MENHTSILVKVISLPSEIERRKSISSQLENLNIKFSYFDAVDLRTESLGDIAKLSSLKNKSKYQRPLSRGETGCALSHLKCYEEIVKSSNEYALIIEDDADLTRFNNDICKKIIQQMGEQNFDIVLLGYSKLSLVEEKKFYKLEPLKTICKIDSFNLGLPWKNWTSGTVAYLIKRNTCSIILKDFYENKNKICCLADDWRYFEFLKIKIAHVRPLLVFEKFNKLPSSIEDERSELSKERKREYLYPIRRIRGMVRWFIMSFQLRFFK